MRSLIALGLTLALGACSGPASTGVGAGGHAGHGGDGGAGGHGGHGGHAGGAGGHGGHTGGAGGVVLPASFEVSGVVLDRDGAPVEGAIVLQGGGEPLVTTGPDGAFAVTLTTSIPGVPTVVAAKVGFRSAGIDFEEGLPEGPLELVLIEARPPDNAAGYTFHEPGHGASQSTEFCSHCHTRFAEQLHGSTHASSVSGRLVQDRYAGAADAALNDPALCAMLGGTYRTGKLPGSAGIAIGRCYLGDGVLPDLNPTCAGSAFTCDDPGLAQALRPTAFGACADCHAAGLDGPLGGRDLLEATGIPFEHGIHCDVCHKISDVDLGAPAGTGGRLVMQRPREKLDPENPASATLQVMYGPLLDVPTPFMGGSYQPKFRTSELCAGCHEHTQGALVPGTSLAPRFASGVPIHSTFSEWLEGPWNTSGTQCQFCHMPPDEVLVTGIDVGTADNAGMIFGFVRKPGELRQHTFRGPLASAFEGGPRLVDTAAQLFVSASVVGDELVATVLTHNLGAGHAIPTGEPMRALVLVVSATGCGAPLAQSAGDVVDDVGGALALATVGVDVSLDADELGWPAVASASGALAQPGQVVRALRPTGAFRDYDGVGLFEGSTLPPEDKGLPVFDSVGEATIVSVGQGALTLSQALALAPGDVVLLGEPASLAADLAPSIALAGAPGLVFARVLLDGEGARHVPHHRALDVARDNRIRPQEDAVTSHTFPLPPGCAEGSVTARLFYRPRPLVEARRRGWEAVDYLIAQSSDASP
jgi:hypothetical protein